MNLEIEVSLLSVNIPTEQNVLVFMPFIDCILTALHKTKLQKLEESQSQHLQLAHIPRTAWCDPSCGSTMFRLLGSIQIHEVVRNVIYS